MLGMHEVRILLRSTKDRTRMHEPAPQARDNHAQDFRAQDFHAFLADYRAKHPGDVLVIDEEVSADQDITGVVWTLAAQNKHPMLLFERVSGLGVKVVTNIFGSRERA